MFRFKFIFGTIILLGCVTALHAQYVDNGQDPFSIRWRQINTDKYKIIYSSDFERKAQNVSAIVDTIQNSINFGFSLPARKIPIIIHPENLSSNGMVVWAPKRAELIAAPPRETYALPWLKQLTAHEYRHVVQMSNLRQGTLKYLSFLLGEQVIGAAAGLLPIWFLEGDATLAETQLATFGRGLQPNFTIEYRAYLADSTADQFPVDKWFCGSYRDYIPDRYQLGYQIVNWSYTLHGKEIWNDAAKYSGRYPFLFATKSIALHKYYRTSTEDLFRGAFSDLHDLWKSLPQVENSTRIINTPSTSYTLYKFPLQIDDSTVVALKYDFDRPYRLVAVNPETGAERIITYTGNVTSRPIYANKKLYWTEFRQSKFWEQKNFSVVCGIEFDPSRKRQKQSSYQCLKENLFYITKVKTGFAATLYNPGGEYELLLLDDNFVETNRHKISSEFSVHGMAYDQQTSTLAVITLGDRGMSLMACDINSGRLTPITDPSYVTINNLTAARGRLFYNSIESGRDESHFFDIVESKEYRATTSEFGSVMPSPAMSPEKIFQTTYRRDGYFLSEQTILTDSVKEVTPKNIPTNLVNPKRLDWNLINLDSVDFSKLDTTKNKSTKKYRKGTNLINVHSWAPLSYDPFEILDDRNLNINFGATVVSQNALSNTIGYLSYGRANGENLFKGKIGYYGFAPKIEVSAEYGGGNRLVVIPSGTDPETVQIPTGAGKDYLALKGRIFLPINLSTGYMLRQLTPEVSMTLYNTMFYKPDSEAFSNSYRKSEASLSYTQNVRSAYRDLAPRWGYGVKLSWMGDPFSSSIGSLYSVSGLLLTPGVALHHSLKIRAAVQYQDESTYNLSSKVLFPMGCDYDFAPERLGTVIANYRFPVAYPDGGINEWLYFKRISMGFFAGFSRYKPIVNAPFAAGYMNKNSYGAEIILDINPLRMSNGNVGLTFSIFKASDSKNVGFNVGLSIYQ